MNERLTRLEQSVGRWRRLAVLTALLCMTMVVLGAEQQQDVLRAKKIILADDDNGYRVEIGSTGKGATAFQVWKGDAMQFSAGASPKSGMTIMGVDKDNRIRFVYPPNSLDRP